MREGRPEEEGVSALAFVNRLRRQYEKWDERLKKFEILGNEDAVKLAKGMLEEIENAEREEANRGVALLSQCTRPEREELGRIRERTRFLKERLNTLIMELSRI